eukprot:m.149358 g.149358  ORF g.149358 m.149358 type:complete len:51 (-) comp14234_c1_seq1:155-307(-)
MFYFLSTIVEDNLTTNDKGVRVPADELEFTAAIRAACKLAKFLNGNTTRW